MLQLLPGAGVGLVGDLGLPGAGVGDSGLPGAGVGDLGLPGAGVGVGEYVGDLGLPAFKSCKIVDV